MCVSAEHAIVARPPEHVRHFENNTTQPQHPKRNPIPTNQFNPTRCATLGIGTSGDLGNTPRPDLLGGGRVGSTEKSEQQHNANVKPETRPHQHPVKRQARYALMISGGLVWCQAWSILRRFRLHALEYASHHALYLALLAG